MKKEIVFTEVVQFNFVQREPAVSYQFPTIQKYLDEGYVVKNIFYSPVQSADRISGIALTVHLQRHLPVQG